jgi:hypothetical protein
MKTIFLKGSQGSWCIEYYLRLKIINLITDVYASKEFEKLFVLIIWNIIFLKFLYHIIQN